MIYVRTNAYLQLRRRRHGASQLIVKNIERFFNGAGKPSANKTANLLGMVELWLLECDTYYFFDVAVFLTLGC